MGVSNCELRKPLVPCVCVCVRVVSNFFVLTNFIIYLESFHSSVFMFSLCLMKPFRMSVSSIIFGFHTKIMGFFLYGFPTFVTLLAPLLSPVRFTLKI